MTSPRRILVIMLRRIGDVLLTTPAVRALRKSFPAAEIDFLVEPPAHEMLAGNPDITRVLLYGKGPLNYLYWLVRARASGYDWVIDYMGNPRSAAVTYASRAPVRAGPAHAAHAWAYSYPLRESPEPCYSAREKIRVLRGLGLSPDEEDELPRLTADADSEEAAHRMLNRMRVPRETLIGILPASRRVTRRWPAESFAAVGRMLRESHGAALLVFWGPGERELAGAVRDGIGPGAYLAPETKDLRELAALIGRCRLMLTNCNGPKHIAVARDVPTVTIHGSSDPRCWTPSGDPRHRAVRLEELHCIGCRKNACPYALECMSGLRPEAVHAAALEILGPPRPAGTGASR